MHGISLPPGDFGGDAITRLFTNTLDAAADPYFATIATLRVSSHFLIRRDGALLQFVPCAMRAWHAGVSAWQGRERCNDFSIGIELEGTDTLALRRRAVHDARAPRERARTGAIRSPTSSATATSRRAARPIPGPRSTGRGSRRLIAPRRR